jgi:DNA-binding transcriptional LysR family regulator
VNLTEKKMDLSSLEIFCAVATERSVAQAAQHLASVRSNVTTGVKQLEQELKVQLFSREGRRLTLTPNGHRMFEYAQRLLSVAEEARQTMNPEFPSGRLRIGAMESTAAARLPWLLSAYHSEWPQVDLEIFIGTSAQLVDDVASSRLDCAFVGDPGLQAFPGVGTPFAARGLHATRAYSEHMLLVLPPNHQPVRRPEDLKVTTLAVFSTGCTYRCALESWLGPQDAQGDKDWDVTELASYRAILACVAAGSSFAICPKSILDLQCAPMDVRTQAFGTIDTYLVARSAFSSSAYEKLLRAVQARGHSGLARRHS